MQTVKLKIVQPRVHHEPPKMCTEYKDTCHNSLNPMYCMSVAYSTIAKLLFSN